MCSVPTLGYTRQVLQIRRVHQHTLISSRPVHKPVAPLPYDDCSTNGERSTAAPLPAPRYAQEKVERAASNRVYDMSGGMSFPTLFLVLAPPFVCLAAPWTVILSAARSEKHKQPLLAAYAAQNRHRTRDSADSNTPAAPPSSPPPTTLKLFELTNRNKPRPTKPNLKSHHQGCAIQVSHHQTQT